MALIKCDECGHKISDKSIACPSCGYPTHLNRYFADKEVQESAAPKEEAQAKEKQEGKNEQIPEPLATPEPEKVRKPDTIKAADEPEAADPLEEYEASLSKQLTPGKNRQLKIILYLSVFAVLLFAVCLCYFYASRGEQHTEETESELPTEQIAPAEVADSMIEQRDSLQIDTASIGTINTSPAVRQL